MELQRVLGVDYGTVRIGISLSDPLGITAQPYETLTNDSKFWARLEEILVQQSVKLIVVGMPLNLKGEKAQKAQEVEKFIERLKRESNREVVMWDERFTSAIAQQTLRSMGTKKSDRQKKGVVDAMAAAVMLQSFLDRTKRSLSC